MLNDHKSFKLVFIPAVASEAEYVKEFDNLEDAVLALNTIADYTLLLNEYCLMKDYSNMGMLYRNDRSGWVEIGDDGIVI